MPTPDEVSGRLLAAYQTRRPIPPLRDALSPTDADGAYAVQAASVRRWVSEGRNIVGRKIGLTAVAVQKQLGVDQPDFGLLFDDMLASEDRAIPFAQTMQPKVEAEVAIVLKKPLTQAHHSVADIVDATDYVCAAIEIVGSRIANWDIKLADTVADNASSSHFVLGARKMK